MAMQLPSALDRTFRALSDGTRRSIIHALARGESRRAGDLGRRFNPAQPTISKHLKVFEEAVSWLVPATAEFIVSRCAASRCKTRTVARASPGGPKVIASRAVD